MSPERRPRFRLLAISPGRAHLGGRERGKLLEWLDDMARHVPQVAVQIREKGLDDRAAWELLSRARERFGGTLLVNGRADLAAAVGADGVHLTSEGPPTEAIARRFAESLLIGRSTHSLAEAIAHSGSADYVTLGPAFSTPSKPGAPPLPRAVYERAAQAGVFVLALGGIDTPEAVRSVLDAGAEGIAGIRLFEDPRRLSSVVRLVTEARRAPCYDPDP